MTHTSDLTLKASFGEGRDIYYDIVESDNYGYTLTVSVETEGVGHTAPVEGVVFAQFDPSLDLTTIISTLLTIGRCEIVAASPAAQEFLKSALESSQADEDTELNNMEVPS